MYRSAKWTRKKIENRGSVMILLDPAFPVSPDPDPAPDHARKIFCLLLFEGTFSSFF